MCICGNCGRTIQSQFFYCPWCGESRMKQQSEVTDELLNKKINEIRDRKRYDQLEKMEEQLDNLERELSVLVLSAEMHK